MFCVIFAWSTAAIIAFIINYAAYFAEIYRSGIECIPKGQYEAANVLGYGRAQAFVKIILPQALLRHSAFIKSAKFSGSWAHNVRPYGPCQAECSFTLWTVCLSDCIFLHFYAVKYTSIKIIT